MCCWSLPWAAAQQTGSAPREKLSAAMGPSRCYTRVRLGEVQPADAWLGSVGYAAVLAPAEWAKGRFAGWWEAAVVAGAEPRDWSPLPAEESMVWAREVVAFGEVASEGALEWVAYPRPCRPPNACDGKHS